MKKFKTGIVLLTSAFVSIVAIDAYDEDGYGAFPRIFEISTLNGTNGFVLKGRNEKPNTNFSVGRVGDVNGDGIDDILIGDLGANNYAGQSYVVFGSKNVWLEEIDILSLNGKNGFVINGIDVDDHSGAFVSGAGDVNGDGIADILIGAPNANDGTGQSYVVFGSKESWPALMYLDNLDGRNGFMLNGINRGDKSGLSGNGLGDVNGDGIDDIIISAEYADNQAGESYVVFGSKQTWPRSIDLSDLNGTNGFILNGINRGDKSGVSVSEAGDVNRDGISDILVGASYANNKAGQSYLVLGKQQGWSKYVNINDNNGTMSFNNTNGFIFNGVHRNDESGTSVSGGEDFNGDGIADVLIGANGMSIGYHEKMGQSYVVFGSYNQTQGHKVINLADLNGENGFVLNGISAGDEYPYSSSVSAVRDVNGDGIADILIGAPNADYYRGQSYVVFGSKEPWPKSFNLNNLNGINGFVIKKSSNRFLGYSVSGAGDVNGDGIEDIIIGGESCTAYVIFGCCAESPQFPLELTLEVGGGVLGLTVLGISGYYLYQHYYGGSDAELTPLVESI